jgi:hypothetical protein
VDASPLERAFAEIGAPLQVMEISDETPRAIYGRDLLLLRPDLHVAWRGNALPDDPAELAATATGHRAGR